MKHLAVGIKRSAEAGLFVWRMKDLGSNRSPILLPLRHLRLGLGQHFRPRTLHQLGHLLRDIRMLLGQVVLLAEILAQVVEHHRLVAAHFDGFPFAFADRLHQAVGIELLLAPVVAVPLPVEVAVDLLLALAGECRQDRQAVDVVGHGGLSLLTRDRREGRHDVGRIGRQAADRSGLDLAGPGDNERGADAALVHVALEAA